MRVLLPSAALAVTLAAFGSVSISLAQEPKKEPAGSVSGRVTLGDTPVPRAVVMLTTTDRVPMQRTPPARATTDEDGRYRLTGVPAGSYTIAPFTPALVVTAETPYTQPGKSIALSEGEEVEGIDFSLTRGGVITGRVTDADGRPLIEQYVNIIPVDERGQRLPNPYFNPFRFSTDDRGVYRLFGLAPGRYKASVGDSPDSGTVRIGYGGGVYTLTFHPDVADESKAAVIEVRAGSEARDVDIKLGRASKTHVAMGRILDADSGKPLSNLQYGFGSLNREQTNIGSYGWSNDRTNDNGEFRIEGLAAGRYAAFAVAIDQVDFYSEPAVFEVNDSDVSGLEIKVRRGSTISGLAVLEGSEDADVIAQMSQLDLAAFVRTEDVSAPSIGSARINPDGSFRITGLRPGKARISFRYNPASPRGFSLLRIERDGVIQSDGIETGPGETVSGVRVVLGFGTGVVHGQVTFEGGQPTPDLHFRVFARRLGSDGQTTASTATVSAMVDSRGRFRLQGLMPGDYEIVLNPLYVPPSPGSPPSRGPPKTAAKQNVNVTNGTESEVTLVVNLGAKN